LIAVIVTLAMTYYHAGDTDALLVLQLILMVVLPGYLLYKNRRPPRAAQAGGGSVPAVVLNIVAVVLLTAAGAGLAIAGQHYAIIGQAAAYIVYAAVGAFVLYWLYETAMWAGAGTLLDKLPRGGLQRMPFGEKLLMAEALAVLLYVSYPTIKRTLASVLLTGDSSLFLPQPVSLKMKRDLSNFWKLNGLEEGEAPGDPAYNYTLGGWFFVNNSSGQQTTENGAYTPILDYGGVPTVLCDPVRARLKVTTRVARGEVVKLYEGVMPLQKWTNVVVTFSGGQADVFVNNVLVATTPGVVVADSRGTLSTGHGKAGEPGVPGGVTDVSYTPGGLRRYAMGLRYRLFTPPEALP
jgi:hypothetical protein